MQTLINPNLKIRVLEELDIKGQDIIKRIYSVEGLSPTLSTMMGGNRQPKIVTRRTKKEVNLNEN